MAFISAWHTYCSGQAKRFHATRRQAQRPRQNKWATASIAMAERAVVQMGAVACRRSMHKLFAPCSLVMCSAACEIVPRTAAAGPVIRNDRHPGFKRVPRLEMWTNHDQQQHSRSGTDNAPADLPGDYYTLSKHTPFSHRKQIGSGVPRKLTAVTTKDRNIDQEARQKTMLAYCTTYKVHLLPQKHANRSWPGGAPREVHAISETSAPFSSSHRVLGV